MPHELLIDPITRIEGHLGVKAVVDNERVVDAYCLCTLWRGFEKIVVGRDPRDAPIILSRICGVCHEVHRLTSILAIEDAVKVVPPPNAVKIRNVIEAITTMYSHAAHLLVLAGPDYAVYGLAGKEHPYCLELDLNKYYALLRKYVLPAQRLCHEALAIFGGKVPHHMTTLPGGVTVNPTPDKIAQAYAKMKEAIEIIGFVYDYVKDKFIPHVVSEHPDVLDVLLNMGVGVKNFLAYGVYNDPDDPTNINKRVFKPGVIVNGEKQALNPNKIEEHVKYSWYTDESGGKPSEEPPPKDLYGKSGAYSWAKAPRYDGKPCEVGPLARLLVNGMYKPLSKHGASALDRNLARLEELKMLADVILDWILQIEPGGKVYSDYEFPSEATGLGLWEAPRGALLHFIKMKDRKIERYQCVVPTTWNASPRDAQDVRGPIEEALVGTPVPGNKDILNPVRVVRSFDPCLACTVHLVAKTGARIASRELEHAH